MAKLRGFRSRAAFKLIQIDEKFQIFQPGFRVIDLGAAPGGWTQVARLAVGASGMVVAVDIDEMRPLPYDNVKIVRLDITREDAPEVILKVLGARADVVLCDASPNLTGIWDMDQYRQLKLAKAAFRIAGKVLRRGGNFVTKIFQGADTRRLIDEMSGSFRFSRIFKPAASRKESAEMYFIGKGFRTSASPLRGGRERRF